MNYTKLVNTYWQQQVQHFHNLIQNERAKGGVDMVRAAEHQVMSGGKRLRAVLPLGVCLAFQSQEPSAKMLDAALWAGLSTEIFHNATLCHDDIADGDRIRRDKPTVWAEFGVSQALNTGDYLMALADEALLNMPLDPIQINQAFRLSKRLNRRVFLGQSLEFSLGEGKILPDEKTYQEIVEGKTGALFALCLTLGGLISQENHETLAGLEELGLALGKLFQVQDDLLDLIGDKGRKEKACDIWEGKPSWLITYCVSQLDRAAQTGLKNLLYLPRAEKKQSDVEQILALMEQCQAIQAGLQYFESLSHRIKEQVQADFPVLEAMISTFLERIAQPLKLSQSQY